MRGVRSLGFIFYGHVFENGELKESLGYSYDLWIDEFLDSSSFSLAKKKKNQEIQDSQESQENKEKDKWKKRDVFKKQLGIEVIFYEGEEDTHVAIAIKDSVISTCSGLADILNTEYLKVDKAWDVKFFSALKNFTSQAQIDIDKIKPKWYFLTKPEI